MDKKAKEEKEEVMTLEVVCPKCGYKKIIYTPKENIPKCPKCGTQMMISEILTEGKYY